MLLNEVFEKYMNYSEFLLRNSTKNSDLMTYNKHIKFGLGLREISDISFMDIQNFCNTLIKKEYQIKTVKNILSKLSVIFNFGIRLGSIEKNPCNYVELPKFDNKRYFDYDINTQKKIIRAIIENKGKNCDIFFFLLHGRRKNEVLSLRWSNIDFENKSYTIPFEINKAKRSMTYSMSDELYNRLFSLSLRTECPILDNFVFVNENTNNRFYDLRKSWNSFLKIYDLPRIRLHDIRHLVATYSINFLKIPVEQVSFVLGHTNITTTQRYITNDISLSKSITEMIMKSV